MPWLIISVEPRENDTRDRLEASERRLDMIVRPHAEREPHVVLVDGLLRERGFMLAPFLTPAPLPLDEWPLLAYVYVSQAADGRGRITTLHRWASRKIRP